MRGQHNETKQMKRGQTIAAERERVESESERLLERKKIRRKRRRSVLLGLVFLLVLGALLYITGRNAMERYEQENKPEMKEYILKARIVDEDNRGQISERTKEYAALLEQDLQDLGYTVTQIILPSGTSRELYVDIEGEEAYIKVSTDRDTAVIAEDTDRMLKYLKKNDLHPGYVDVRVEGKGYYK